MGNEQAITMTEKRLADLEGKIQRRIPDNNKFSGASLSPFGGRSPR